MPWLVPVLAAAVIALTACVEVTSESDTGAGQPLLAGLFGPSTGQGPSAQSTPQATLEQVSFADGAVVVSGPRGYCIDPTTLRRRPTGFAVIASCRILANGVLGAAVDPVLVTVTVGQADGTPLPTATQLAAGAGGRVVSQRDIAGMVLVQLEDPDASILSDGDSRYWRGVFRQGSRLVGLALYAPDGSPLAGASGANMLRDVQMRIVGLSPDPESPALATGRSGG